MSTPGLMAVFDSVGRAEAAREQLHAMGVPAVLSIDLTADGIAAEVPGQAYQNQPGQGGDGHATASLIGLLSGRTADEQQAVARRAARVQSGGCVLSVDLGRSGAGPAPAADRAGVRAVLQAHGARHLDRMWSGGNSAAGG